MGSPHLAWRERYQIQSLCKEGHKAAVIALRLGRSVSSIYRELKRGAREDGSYSADRAQLRRDEYAQRSAANHRVKPASVWAEVGYGIQRGWTPEQVTGRFDLVIGRAPAWGERVSTPAIYAWIRREARPLMDRLRRLRRLKSGRGGHRGGGLPAHRTSITERPSSVQTRRKLGHWEADSVLGRERRARLITLVERKSRYLVVRRTSNGLSETVARSITSALSPFPVKSLTFDNGSEFAAFSKIEKQLSCKTFFAHPHSPWERGTNENINGLLRDFFSRYDYPSKISHQRVASFAHHLNHRPRKCLGFKTPHEVLFALSPVAFRT